MPSIPSPEGLSKSPLLQIAVKGALVEFAQNVLKNETPIVSPDPGYKAYEKRMALAAEIILAPDLYKEAGARLVAACQPDIEINEQATYRYLIQDNPSNRNVFENEFSNAGGFQGSVAIDRQMFSQLAGVDLSDFI